MIFDYDIIIVGGGAAGLTAAKTAKGFGKRVAIIEKTDRLGGECTWTGCIPSKALIKVAQVAWHIKHAQNYGLKTTPIDFDLTAVMPYIRTVIQEDYQSHTPSVLKESGIDILFGDVQFNNRHQIDLNGRSITFKQAIITTGSRPFVPPIAGLDRVPYLTNENLFSLEVLPKSIIILGGGPIGSEMASALNRLGVAVTVVEMQDRILPKEDEEVVALLAHTMQQEGVTIITKAKATKVSTKNNKSVVTIEVAKTMRDLEADQILVAIGRRPNIEGLHLDRIGVATTDKGIITDTTMKTSVANIYAAGDVVGPYQFSHVAWYQAMAAARNACIPLFKHKISFDHLSWVTFTAPELARMGCTEQQAREQYDAITVFHKPYNQLDRAITDRTTNGLAKYIVNKKGYLIGAHILGSSAGDVLDALQLAKEHDIPFYKLGSIIHSYPTYAEINWHAARRAYLHHLQKNFFVKLLQRFFIRNT